MAAIRAQGKEKKRGSPTGEMRNPKRRGEVAFAVDCRGGQNNGGSQRRLAAA